MTDKEYPPLTAKQRASLHVWLRQVAETLNLNGLDMKKTLKPSAEIPWSEGSAKEHLWRPVMETVYPHIESTNDMTTVDPDLVVDIIVRHIADKFAVTLPPWPDRFGERQ
jgi:hypothetical protein|tara:strand:- start:2383 stop:2712 length:330 start_codon:yes stop_codon:yes gene_type:complete